METKYLILDTNILLLDALNLELLAQPGTVVVLPDIVINECDSKKSVAFGELGFQARSLGRIIAKSTIVDISTEGPLAITSITLKSGGSVHITSCSYPDFDVDEHTLNDRKIIHVAELYNALPDSTTTFMSNDVMCRITALGLGLTATDLKVTEKTSYEFIKEFVVEDATLFSMLHKTPIMEIDPDYIHENYNYKFSNPDTARIKLATISNTGLVEIIGKDSEKELRTQSAPPLNAEQLLLSAAIQEPTNDVILCEARAGSGKTITALSNAIRLVTLGKYSSILYIRGTINDVSTEDEEVGFLSGNEEKMAIYLHALYDSLDFIIRKRLSNTKLKGKELEERISDETQKLTEQCDIQAMVPLGMRGRTFHDSILIIDEATSLPPATMQKILTRVGKNSKVIIIGSQNQIDSKFLTKFNNGMSLVLDAATKPSGDVKVHAINLYRVARSPICEWAESVFSGPEGN